MVYTLIDHRNDAIKNVLNFAVKPLAALEFWSIRE